MHQKLYELSKRAHELAKKYYEQNDVVAQEALKKLKTKSTELSLRFMGSRMKNWKREMAVFHFLEMDDEPNFHA